MSAAMVFKSNGTAILNPARSPKAAASHEPVVLPVGVQAFADVDAGDWERLSQRFEDLSWQTFATASTLVLTLVSGAFFCAHLFAGVA